MIIDRYIPVNLFELVPKLRLAMEPTLAALGLLLFRIRRITLNQTQHPIARLSVRLSLVDAPGGSRAPG